MNSGGHQYAWPFSPLHQIWLAHERLQVTKHPPFCMFLPPYSLHAPLQRLYPPFPAVPRNMQRPVLQSRDLSNAVKNLVHLCDRSGLRYCSKAGPEWDAAHPAGFWRSDGSLYKNRAAQQPVRSGRGLQGPLLALAAGGLALWYVRWPNSSAPASTADIQQGISVLTNTLKKALSFSGRQKELEANQPGPDAHATGACGLLVTMLSTIHS